MSEKTEKTLVVVLSVVLACMVLIVAYKILYKPPTPQDPEISKAIRLVKNQQVQELYNRYSCEEVFSSFYSTDIHISGWKGEKQQDGTVLVTANATYIGEGSGGGLERGKPFFPLIWRVWVSSESVAAVSEWAGTICY